MRQDLPPVACREGLAAVLGNPDTPATVILMIVLARYRDEVFGNEAEGIEPADPVELYARIKDDYRVELPEENENRLQALHIAISTDGFFQDPQIFRAVCLALNDGDIGDVATGVLEDLTVPEMLWAIWEVGANRDSCPEFAPAVSRIFDAEIQEEAEENPELDAGEVVPHYIRYVALQQEELAALLTTLGVDPKPLLHNAKENAVTPHAEKLAAASA